MFNFFAWLSLGIVVLLVVGFFVAVFVPKGPRRDRALGFAGLWILGFALMGWLLSLLS